MRRKVIDDFYYRRIVLGKCRTAIGNLILTRNLPGTWDTFFYLRSKILVQISVGEFMSTALSKRGFFRTKKYLFAYDTLLFQLKSVFRNVKKIRLFVLRSYGCSPCALAIAPSGC